MERYEAHRFLQVRVVRRTALIDIAAGPKGIKDSGNILGNKGNTERQKRKNP